LAFYLEIVLETCGINFIQMKKIIVGLVWINLACNNPSNAHLPKPKDGPKAVKQNEIICNNNANTIATRFAPPPGFERQQTASNTIQSYMRNLPLQAFGSKVHYYNGAEKNKPNVYIAVIDLPIGNKDLHQCADGVMNLWANYLYNNNRYADIQFKFLNDNTWHNFKTWSGGNVSKKNFAKYMEQVWSAANTRSLFGQTTAITKNEITIGDMLIVTGNPYGHAMIIVDECINPTTNKKMFMLAQSYMPAQDMQIVINPLDANNSPWYSFDETENIITPEWDFTIENFRRF
jgi:hypothetical protein